ncbi:hypothetical protein ABB26_16850 [Stenotrophomonas humi]|uniref:Uncharacterized protein n=1 Tax=Stenotrophomonas humi TaxID=405444 RepID=A0A0R0BXF1_9GAMM|nr:hypothetical protein [Stenotrophomonas humi]KRG62271.1 hypothetical protein ABB26_16850 [Stenotrophomonas humi]
MGATKGKGIGTLWITFRLKEGVVGGRDYNTCYSALIDAVKKHNTSGWWFEPTSFWLVGSNSTVVQMAANIKLAIAPSEDLALIGSMDKMGTVLVGKAEKLADLKALAGGLIVG